jgi:TolB-like protein
MPSLIPGYNYDIFISYRQKDNKHDGWVTEFVDNLKGELESTFKEEISVYFDINPHDGLLETHDVDASLKEKLKCLVFIPIISRTYCDPKSFAWEHEFKAFVKLASDDQFGLKIRLPNGNVASRVLPVRIHDLDIADITLCEEILDGVMRGVEFIYKEPGVNRSLTPDDDEKVNLNRTKYRNQINKVALTINDIIQGLKTEPEWAHLKDRIEKETYNQPVEKKEKAINAVNKKPIKSVWLKLIIIMIIIAVLAIAAILVYPKFFKQDRLEYLRSKGKISVAVLPFTNLSDDPEQEYFSEGVVDAILNYLFKVGELKVKSSTSTKRYKNPDQSLKEIARELGVSYILEGSVQKIGNNVRITAQLIDAQTDVHVWSEIYDRDISDIFSIQSEVAQNVARELRATLTSEEKEQIEKKYTENPEAYNLYLQGRFSWYRRKKDELDKSVEYFKKAIEIDPNYALAYAGLADAYFIQAFWGWVPWDEGSTKSKELALKALDLDKNLAEAHTVLGALYNYKEWRWKDARKELQLAIELDPNFVTAHHYYSELLNILRQNDEARKQINQALELDPFVPVLHVLSGAYYYNEGKLQESVDECRIMEDLDPEYSDRAIYWREFNIYSKQKEDLKALDALQKALFTDTVKVNNSSIVKDIYNKSGIEGIQKWLLDRELNNKLKPSPSNTALRYSILGEIEEALNWLEKAFENPDPGFPGINNNPDFDILRSDPRFKAIINKMGLSDYAK